MKDYILIRMSLDTSLFFNINNKMYMKNIIIDYFSIIVKNCRSVFFDFEFRVQMSVEHLSGSVGLLINGFFFVGLRSDCGLT